MRPGQSNSMTFIVIIRKTFILHQTFNIHGTFNISEQLEIYWLLIITPNTDYIKQVKNNCSIIIQLSWPSNTEYEKETWGFQIFTFLSIKYTLSAPGQGMSDSKGCKLKEQNKMLPETRNLLFSPSSPAFSYWPFWWFVSSSSLKEDH